MPDFIATEDTGNCLIIGMLTVYNGIMEIIYRTSVNRLNEENLNWNMAKSYCKLYKYNLNTSSCNIMIKIDLYVDSI